MTRSIQVESLEDALAALQDDPALVPVAGCTDLMVTTPEGRADLPGVIDLTSIASLSGVRETDQGVSIGAVTTFTEIGRNAVIAERFPALAQAARVIGGWQIQNRATIGGNIANASPAGDSLPVLLALDAELEVARQGERRRIPYREFHVGYRDTALAADELISGIHLPTPPENARQAFRKVGTREAQAISKVVVAAMITVHDGVIADARLAAGSVAPVPIRLFAAEERAVGAPADEATADAVSQAAADSVSPIDDVRSTADYRRFALQRVVRRILLQTM